MLAELTLSDWARMRDEVARRECEELAGRLPYDLQLTGLADHSYCGHTHRVARFSLKEKGGYAQFVLVPGGEVRLGFDVEEFRPSPSQLKSYERSARQYKLNDSIERFVDSQTSAPRTVYLQPVLVEADARPVERRDDIQELDCDDPKFQEYERIFPGDGKWEPWSGNPNECHHVVERKGGVLRVWRRPSVTMQHLEARLAAQRVRLPTCDEWEHVCGAGTRTLFRWGNINPSDFYPTDTCAEDRMLKTAWALSFGRLQYETPSAEWDLHLQSNLFGLGIAGDPYRPDLVSDGPLALGGDGGCRICGGMGFFLGWLPLATAFRDPWGMKIRPEVTNVADDYHRLRRVIPLA